MAVSIEQGATLLEREDPLTMLADALAHARCGRGRIALISGEAGIGKTAVVTRFARECPAPTRVLTAACEALQTPRPFGPVVDIADRLPDRVARAVHAGEPYSGLFPDFLAWATEQPTAIVLEDLHWADAATLDLVRYVSRRMEAASLLLVLTYRDEETALEHPLRQVLGGLPRGATVRAALAPLSEAAVASLAQAAGRASNSIHRITGGNPFFVTELLACAEGAMPVSVRDAVLARVGALSQPAREIALWVSIAPQEMERSLLHELAAPDPEALEEVLDRGVLTDVAGALRFRHELARACVEQWLAGERRTRMHGAVFEALGRRPDTGRVLARRVHHAQQAGFADAVVALAPLAARAAAAASAHRDAAALYALSLRHADRFERRVLLEVLEEHATECMLVQAVEEAATTRKQALALHRESGDVRAQGWNLTRLAVLRITQPEALELSSEAVALLEQLGPGRELAWACADRAAVLTARARATEALEWGRRGLALAETLGEPEVLAHALNICGAVELSLEYNANALGKLERSLALAQANGLPHKVGLAYLNLAGMALVNRDHERLLNYAERGLAFAAGRDLDFVVAGLRLRRMFCWFDLGRWREVMQELDRLDAMPALLPRERNTVRLWRARLHALTGTENDPALWAELLALGSGAQTELRPGAVAATCAEAAWLRNDLAAAERILIDALPPAIASGEPTMIGELLVWLLRCGAKAPQPEVEIAPEYRPELDGDWRRAAAGWEKLGCAYERALVLLAGDESALAAALEIFSALGAQPLIEMTRRGLRQRGARGIQRGPYNDARKDPLGLTRREREIFELVVQGHSTPAIARRLHRSERTIEHHIAGIFEKLGVTSRGELRPYAGGSIDR